VKLILKAQKKAWDICYKSPFSSLKCDLNSSFR